MSDTKVPVDDTDPSVVYSGQWTPQRNSDALDQSLHVSTTPGSSASFSFTSTSILVVGAVPPCSNTGAPLTYAITLMARPSPRGNGVLLYFDTTLSDGAHKVTITNSGSGSPALMLDYFAYGQGSGSGGSATTSSPPAGGGGGATTKATTTSTTSPAPTGNTSSSSSSTPAAGGSSTTSSASQSSSSGGSASTTGTATSSKSSSGTQATALGDTTNSNSGSVNGLPTPTSGSSSNSGSNSNSNSNGNSSQTPSNHSGSHSIGPIIGGVVGAILLILLLLCLFLFMRRRRRKTRGDNLKQTNNSSSEIVMPFNLDSESSVGGSTGSQPQIQERNVNVNGPLQRSMPDTVVPFILDNTYQRQEDLGLTRPSSIIDPEHPSTSSGSEKHRVGGDENTSDEPTNPAPTPPHVSNDKRRSALSLTNRQDTDRDRDRARSSLAPSEAVPAYMPNDALAPPLPSPLSPSAFAQHFQPRPSSSIAPSEAVPAYIRNPHNVGTNADANTHHVNASDANHHHRHYQSGMSGFSNLTGGASQISEVPPAYTD
ncbi:hypothetical protein CPB84DRAFT_1845502 [Gymnopilus junonius]|uniref:Uncharacterized protein n=1 Tax=Gymnopilus junonius TaxID=109634 RepID=A0A9P5NT33_GYMJU|nr:hypothetical protein CPB84DRAFT_1845502 [Gymnopilus junonius]